MQSKDMSEKKTDIVVVGAGLTGLSFCNLLKDTNTKIFILDNHSEEYFREVNNDRHIVLSNTSKIILEKLSLWEKIENYCSKVKNIHISKKNIFGSTLIRSTDENLDSLGYQVPIKYLIRCLYENIKNVKNFEFLYASEVLEVSNGNLVKLRYKQNARENLVIANSAIFSSGYTDSIFQDIFIEKVEKKYNQNAVACEVISSENNSDTAYERFTDQGIIAAIPRKENSWTLIYSTSEEESEKIINFSKKDAKIYLQKLVGKKCGIFSHVNNIKSYPLQLKYYKKFINKNICLLGDAAHTLHPIAAQSFNLSLRDCTFLTNQIKKNKSKENVKYEDIFQEYYEERIKEQIRLVKFTDFLASYIHGNGFFKNNLVGVGLMFLDINKNIRVNTIRYLLGVNFSQSLITNLTE